MFIRWLFFLLSLNVNNRFVAAVAVDGILLNTFFSFPSPITRPYVHISWVAHSREVDCGSISLREGRLIWTLIDWKEVKVLKLKKELEGWSGTYDELIKTSSQHIMLLNNR